MQRPCWQAINSLIALLSVALLGSCEKTAVDDIDADDAVAAEDDSGIGIMIPPANGTIAWLGDSITHRAGYTQYLETFFVTRYPQLDWQTFNRGVAGDRAADVLARYAEDEDAQNVGLAFVQLGMNDGGYRRWRDETGELFASDLAKLLDQISARQTEIILVSPTVYDVEAEWRDQLRDGEPLRSEDRTLLDYDSVLVKLDAIVRRIAAERQLAYVDVRTPLLKKMHAERSLDAAYSLIPDSLHPSADGHAIMAVEILRLARPAHGKLFEVHLAKQENGQWHGKLVTGGKLEALSVGEIQHSGQWYLSFVHTSQPPWLVPEDALDGFDAAGGDDLNRQVVKVTGLEPGAYLLSLDDFVAGTFTAQQLAAGINVDKISGTPQRQQGAQIAELNRVRNQGPVRSRQDWQADLRNRAAALEAMQDPEEKREAQIEFDLWRETHRQALIDLEAEEKKLWLEIREAARAKPLRYELRRLPDGYREFAE